MSPHTFSGPIPKRTRIIRSCLASQSSISARYASRRCRARGFAAFPRADPLRPTITIISARVRIRTVRAASDRHAAEIHHRLRLREDHFFPRDLPMPDVRLCFRARRRESRTASASASTAIKPRLCGVHSYSRTRIAEADDERIRLMIGPDLSGRRAIRRRRATSSSRPFRLGRRARPPSPSSSFLPFLITSGSAGAASAATAASGAALLPSSDTDVREHALRIGDQLHLRGDRSAVPRREAACRCSGSVTSMLNSSGMSPGKHSISTSRVTISKTPPWSLTPAARRRCAREPYAHADVHGHAEKIDVEKAPLTGSTCQSFTMAFSSPPSASSTVKMVLWPLSERRIAPTCLALTVSEIGSFCRRTGRPEPCRSGACGARDPCRGLRESCLLL